MGRDGPLRKWCSSAGLTRQIHQVLEQAADRTFFLACDVWNLGVDEHSSNGHPFLRRERVDLFEEGRLANLCGRELLGARHMLAIAFPSDVAVGEVSQ